jgi:hypothetical protein
MQKKALNLKYLIFTIVGLFIALKINAQEKGPDRFQVGIEIGPNLSILYGNSPRPYHYVPAVSFSGGITFSAILVNHLSIRADLCFNRKIEKIKEDVNYSPETSSDWIIGKAHSIFDYLTLPLLAQYFIGRKVKFVFNIGPYFGILLNTKSFVETPENKTYSFTYKSNKIDFGITSGVGVSVSLTKKWNITFETRNNLGLIPVFPKYKELKFNSTDFLVGCTYAIP